MEGLDAEDGVESLCAPVPEVALCHPRTVVAMQTIVRMKNAGNVTT
jgi:hypothetical protein